ncbi:hypothetical protein GQ457_03G008460 [Hibiscus cannabinus]
MSQEQEQPAPASQSDQLSSAFDLSRMIDIIKRNALIKELDVVYHSECLAYCQELLELQKKWNREIMSPCKWKITKDPPATNSEVEKCKAVWDLKATEYFIQGYLDQVSKGERNGTTLIKKGWQAVTSYFFDLTGKKYDKSQFKNKWDSLKRELSIWYILFAKETSIGWDSMKNIVDASNEWWEQKIAENPKYGKFRNKGLPFYNELTILFKDVTATGEFAWAQSSEILPNGLGGNEGDEEDVYRPSPIDLDMEEGSGDSEDASVGASNEFNGIHLNSSQGTVNQNSEGKRKRVGQDCQPPPMLLSSSALTPQLLLLSPPNSSTNLTLPRAHLYSSSLRHVSSSPTFPDDDGPTLLSSASAVSAAIRRASTSPVDFTQRIEKNDHRNHKLIMPTPDFQRLCLEQLDLFRRIVDPDALLSVYVRPAGIYVMDQLELRRVTSYPSVKAADIVFLVGNFTVPAGLRAAEAAISSQHMEVVGEHRAVVFPMVKQPFVVGFLVAELPELEEVPQGAERGDMLHCPIPEEPYALSSPSPGLGMKKPWEIQYLENEPMRQNDIFTVDQRSNAINISRTLAVAYVMDQKAILLQQSTWQNNVRMGALVEQIRGPLSSIRTLSKMLSTHVKENEISHDIVEDILVQGDRIKGTLQELQDAVHLTKANIMHYNEESLRKMRNSTHSRPESLRSQLSDDFSRDKMPMPPLALAPLRENGIRKSCNISDVLADLVDAVRPLAHKQQRMVELSELSQPLQVAIEEPALCQALSNLIEGALLRTQVGGKVEIVSTSAPAGGALLVIDDDGPDMHYMTQMHSLTPFGAELFSENMIEDNMTLNFVAGLTVAREILESYGCVVRVMSPRTTEAALGAGGTRVELWLPSFSAVSDMVKRHDKKVG